MVQNCRSFAVDDTASKESTHEEVFKGYDFGEDVDFGGHHG